MAYFLPVGYVDTSDIWMAGRWPRATVAVAGPYLNIVLSSLVTLLIPLAPSGEARIALFPIGTAGYGLALMKLNPLGEFDGYYARMDWLDIPNLRAKALAFLGAVLWSVPRSVQDARLIRIFTRGPDGRRPVYASRRKFQEDPYWRDLILFHEYFDGDTGEGLGASHQTGWTSLVVRCLESLAAARAPAAGPAESLED